MAFATANVKANYFGSLNVTTGDWSGNLGDAAGTVTVKGGRVYFANFMDQDATSPQPVDFQVSASQSGAVTTLTVNNNNNVTAGRFLIISA
jgi:hypothetical protein